MSTLFQFPSTGTADVSPTPSGSDWAHINTVSRPLELIDSLSAFATLTYTPDAGDDLVNANAMIAQFVSQILPAQTIPSQVITFGIMAREALSTNNLFVAWKVYAVTTDGLTVLGTMVPLQRDGTEVAQAALEGRTDFNLTSTQVVCNVPFRIVAEIGLGGTPSGSIGTDGHNGELQFGGNSINFAFNTVTTSSKPWMQFNDDLIIDTVDVFPGTPSLSYGMSFGSSPAGVEIYSPMGGVVKVANGDWYVFFMPLTAGGRLSWRKSADQGRTWGIENIVTTNTMIRTAIWYDRWTPGDSGNLIHIVWTETTTHDVRYANLNVLTDTLSAITQVFNGASFVTNPNSALSIVKTRAANIYIVFDGDGGTEVGHYVAASPYTSWSSKTDANEAASTDWYFALPGNYADTDDYDLYFINRSANGWSRKTYDASANTWSEAALVADGSFIDSGTVFPQHAGCIRLSDKMQFAFGWNDYDAATADLVGFKFDGTTSAALTNVVTNSDDCGGVAAMYDEAADRLYVFYLGKSNGTEVISATVGIYYKYSDDDGATWSAEQTLFDAYLDDFRYIACALNIASISVAPPVIWQNDDTDELLTTAENPVPASSGGLIRHPGMSGGLNA